MAVFSLWVINKAGGLVYQRNFAEGLSSLTSNEYLVLAGTLHGIHAITSRLSPIPGTSSGAQVIEAETFRITILLTPTGTKFVLLSSLPSSSSSSSSTTTTTTTTSSASSSSPEGILQRVYEAYADAVMKNPFHTPEMPIRSEGFDTRVGGIIGSGAG